MPSITDPNSQRTSWHPVTLLIRNIMTKSLSFQQIILKLQDFWTSRGCTLWQPYNHQVGAGTMNPATALRVLGPEPWNVAYVEPSVRTDDGRYGDNPTGCSNTRQFQVILKPIRAIRRKSISIHCTRLASSAKSMTSALSRITGNPPHSARGAWVGKCGLTAGDHTVHVLPAGRRPGARSGVGGTDLRTGTHCHVLAGRAQRVRDRL